MSRAFADVDVQGNRRLWSIPAAKCESDITISDGDGRYMLPVTFRAHDTAKDSTSEYLADGFAHQIAMFHVPA